MKVIATQTGFDGKRIRNPGDEFEMPDDQVKGSTWFVPADKAKVKGQKPAEPKAEGSDNAADLT